MKTTALTEAAIFGRLFDGDEAPLSASAARSILKLDFKPEDRQRMNELAEKARQGLLSDFEDEELEKFIHVGQLLAIMQSKARKSLRRATDAS